jgi:hypothetical protein
MGLLPAGVIQVVPEALPFGVTVNHALSACALGGCALTPTMKPQISS